MMSRPRRTVAAALVWAGLVSVPALASAMSPADRFAQPEPPPAAATAPLYLAQQSRTEFGTAIPDMPVLSGVVRKITIGVATPGVGGAAVTYSAVNPPDWLDASEIANRVLEINPTSGDLGVYTITIDAGDGTTTDREEFKLHVIRPAGFRPAFNRVNPDDRFPSLGWRLGNRNPRLEVFAEFCGRTDIPRPDLLISRLRIEHALHGRLATRDARRCATAQRFSLPFGNQGTSNASIWHQLIDRGGRKVHRVFFPKVASPGTYTMTIGFGLFSRTSYVAGSDSYTEEQFDRLEVSAVYNLINVNVTIAEIGPAPIGHPLATITFADNIASATWDVNALNSARSSPLLRVQPVGGVQNQAVIELAEPFRLDYELLENPRILTVIVDSYSPNTATPLVQNWAQLVLEVADVDETAGNQPPEFVSSSLSNTISEYHEKSIKTPPGTVVGTLAATDPNSSDNLFYRIVGSNIDGNLTLGLDAATGVLTLAQGTLFDIEGKASYTIRVEVLDSRGGSASADFVLNIEDRALKMSIHRGLYDTLAFLGSSHKITVAAETTTANATISYALINDPPAWLSAAESADAYVITFEPRAESQVGNHMVTVSISDGSANLEREFRIQVIRPMSLIDNMDGWLAIDVLADFCKENLTPLYSSAKYSLNGRGHSGIVPSWASSNGCIDPTTTTLPIGKNGAAITLHQKIVPDRPRSGHRLRSEFSGLLTQPGTYRLTVEYSNRNSVRNSRIIYPQINDTIKVPFIYEFAKVTVTTDEVAGNNSAAGITLATISVSHLFQNQSTWRALPGTPAPLDVILLDGGQSAEVRIGSGSTVAVDFESSPVFITATIEAFTVGRRPPGAPQHQHALIELVVNLRDVDDTANSNPVFVAGSLLATISESRGRVPLAAGLVVATVAATDDDLGDSVTYSIEDAYDGSLFAIGASNGQVSLAAARHFDYESRDRYTLQVRATDRNEGSAIGLLVLSIADALDFSAPAADVPLVLNQVRRVTIAAAAGSGSFTYSAQAPSWIDTSDIANRVLVINPTADSQLGVHTVTVAVAAAGARYEEQFMVAVIRPPRQVAGPAGWWRPADLRVTLDIATDFCAVAASGAIARMIAKTTVSANPVISDSFAPEVCGRSFTTTNNLNIEHQFSNNRYRRVISVHQLPGIDPGPNRSAAGGIIYSSPAIGGAHLIDQEYAWQDSFGAVFATLKLAQLQYYLADVAISAPEGDVPAGSKLAEIWMPTGESSESVVWQVLGAPQVSITVAELGDNRGGSNAVVELAEAVTLDFETAQNFLAATIQAYLPDDAGVYRYGQFRLAGAARNVDEPPAFAAPLADQQVAGSSGGTFSLAAATDPEGEQTVVHSLANPQALPSGVTFDADSRTFTIASGTRPGAYRLIIRTSESGGAALTGEHEFVLYITGSIDADASALDTLDVQNPRSALPVQLTTQPTVGGRVTLTITSVSDSLLAVQPATMIFTDSDWNTAQSLTLSLTTAGKRRKAAANLAVGVSVFAPATAAANYRNVAAATVLAAVDVGNADPVFASSVGRIFKDENVGASKYPVGELFGAPIVAADPDNSSGLIYSINPASELFAIDEDSGQLRLKTATNFITRADAYRVTVEVHDNEPAAIRGRATLEALVFIRSAPQIPGPYSNYDLQASKYGKGQLRVTWNNDEHQAQFPRDRFSLAGKRMLFAYQGQGAPAVTVELALDATVHLLAGLDDGADYTVSLAWPGQLLEPFFRYGWSERHVVTAPDLSALDPPGPYSSYDLQAAQYGRGKLLVTWNNDEYRAEFADYAGDMLFSYESSDDPAVVVRLAMDTTVHLIAGLTAGNSYTLSLAWPNLDGHGWSSQHVFTAANVNNPPVWHLTGRGAGTVVENFGRNAVAKPVNLGGGSFRQTVVSCQQEDGEQLRLCQTSSGNQALRVFDLDEDPITYALVGESEHFQIDANSGDLSTKPINFNYEQEALSRPGMKLTYTVTIQASDNFTPPGVGRLTATVELVNNNRGEIPDRYVNHRFAAADTNQSEVILTWSNLEYHNNFDPVDRGRIGIDYSKGDTAIEMTVSSDVLHATHATVTIGDLQPHTSYSFLIKWYSADGWHQASSGNHDLEQWTVRTSTTGMPALVAGSLAATINENSGTVRSTVGTVIGTVAATPETDGRPMVYRIVPGSDSADFGINANSGVISLAAAHNFNYEDKDLYTLIVRADEQPGGFDQGSFVLSLSNVNDPPAFADPFPFAIRRANGVRGDDFIFPAAVDPDAGDSLTYGAVRINSTDNLAAAGVSFATSSREFTIAPSSDVATVTIRVTATDGDNRADNQEFELHIVDAGIDVV
ncbi:MAG: cadherin domain-containing protein, partial [Betaproteobacteria bacterium]|nr:cadherin domain-containing protein [Betaproteobacteria bacterium]